MTRFKPHRPAKINPAVSLCLLKFVRHYIYHESRWCFVYGQFSAAIALSRTVIEAILKQKFGLEGNLNNIIDLAGKKKIINKEAAWNANKVRMFTNKILHGDNVATKNQAKISIDHVLDFIEEIYLG